MAYRSTLEFPLRMQWESSSRLPPPDPGTAPGNCGPTCVTMVAQFYRDVSYGIYSTRYLANKTLALSTSIGEQRTMLQLRGVPCIISRPSIDTITSILRTQKRPIIIGMRMLYVPLSVAGHPFRGDHAVVLRANAVRNGVAGKLVADPNFSTYTGRTDPTNGFRFYSDSTIQAAYYNPGLWAILPTKDKVVNGLPDTSQPPTITVGELPMAFINRTGWHAYIKAGKPRRAGATTGSRNYGSTKVRQGFPIWGEVTGEDLTKYGLPGGSRWFFGPQYVGSQHAVYIPYCDLENRVGF